MIGLAHSAKRPRERGRAVRADRLSPRSPRALYSARALGARRVESPAVRPARRGLAPGAKQISWRWPCSLARITSGRCRAWIQESKAALAKEPNNTDARGARHCIWLRTASRRQVGVQARARVAPMPDRDRVMALIRLARPVRRRDPAPATVSRSRRPKCAQRELAILRVEGNPEDAVPFRSRHRANRVCGGQPRSRRSTGHCPAAQGIGARGDRGPSQVRAATSSGDFICKTGDVPLASTPSRRRQSRRQCHARSRARARVERKRIRVGPLNYKRAMAMARRISVPTTTSRAYAYRGRTSTKRPRSPGRRGARAEQRAGPRHARVVYTSIAVRKAFPLLTKGPSSRERRTVFYHLGIRTTRSGATKTRRIASAMRVAPGTRRRPTDRSLLEELKADPRGPSKRAAEVARRACLRGAFRRGRSRPRSAPAASESRLQARSSAFMNHHARRLLAAAPRLLASSFRSNRRAHRVVVGPCTLGFQPRRARRELLREVALLLGFSSRESSSSAGRIRRRSHGSPSARGRRCRSAASARAAQTKGRCRRARIPQRLAQQTYALRPPSSARHTLFEVRE